MGKGFNKISGVSGTTTKLFSLRKDVHQGDPISAFLLIVPLEILSIFIKSLIITTFTVHMLMI